MQGIDVLSENQVPSSIRTDHKNNSLVIRFASVCMPEGNAVNTGELIAVQ